MLCVPAANTQRNESLSLYPTQQIVIKSDSFSLIQTPGEGSPDRPASSRRRLSLPLGLAKYHSKNVFEPATWRTSMSAL
jgi:hypothetical protein